MKNSVVINGVTLSREQVEKAMLELQKPTLPEHTITLESAESGVEMVFIQIPSGEWVAKYPTTQAQYNAFCYALALPRPNYYKVGDDLPTTNISWHEANAFAAWLTVAYANHLPKGATHATLPDEALWQKACQAGDTRELTKEETLEAAWCYENSHGTIHPVGQKKPNAWGLYDMLGNVWEWCSNDYKPA